MLRVLHSDPQAQRAAPPYLATSRPARFGDGFYGEEMDEGGPFRWMTVTGRLDLDPASNGSYLELQVLCEFSDLSQQLTAVCGDRHVTLPLVHGWNHLSLEVPEAAEDLELSTNRPFPKAYYPDDDRLLAVRVRPPLLHADPERHGHVSRQHANAVLNYRELLKGRCRLDSTPPMLGIDMYGVCNVKPPCVYCEWDYNKEQEGENVDRRFDRDLLEEWGEFFDQAGFLVNCSIGEPFMMKNFDELLDFFGDRGKFLEISTNGQILSDRNIEKLLGRTLHLYISLDAATPDTYAKLRNDRFERILTNLRRLVAAKGGRGGLPRLFLVFMPMKVNVHELEAFVRLSAELGADRLILRPLNYSERSTLVYDRNGYHFDYNEELLPFDELVRVSGIAAELARRHGVPLSDQLDFGGAMEGLFSDDFEKGRQRVSESTEGEPFLGAAASAATFESTGATPTTTHHDPRPPATGLPSLGEERLPICREPWKGLYILRRGVMPCCYGSHPIARMEEYREAWNSPLVRSIRRELAAGRFHQYCIHSRACPLVRKAHQIGELPQH